MTNRNGANATAKYGKIDRHSEFGNRYIENNAYKLISTGRTLRFNLFVNVRCQKISVLQRAILCKVFNSSSPKIRTNLQISNVDHDPWSL